MSFTPNSFFYAILSFQRPAITILIITGLQIQSTHNRIYSGPVDAIKKILASHGIAGIYKGQVATLTREAVGYGAYFWAYEKLVQREMAMTGIAREQLSPFKAVLYGAAAGYAVCPPLLLSIVAFFSVMLATAMGMHLSYRHDQV